MKGLQFICSIIFLSSADVLFAGASPSITTQPQSQAVLAGSNAVFTVTAGGSLPLMYQWSFNGINLTNSAHVAGATSTTLTISNVIAANAGNYQVIVTNTHGGATSAVAGLTVLLPPTVSAQPQSQSTLLNSNATFAATVSGTPPLVCRWYFNGGLLSDSGRVSGSATTHLSILNVQTNDAGNYQAVVTNNYGSATSSLATLTVLVPPQITAQPQSQTRKAGSNIVLSTIANGTLPLSYGWFFNGAPLSDGGRVSGSATANLTISNSQTNDSGNYIAIITNIAGAATSSVAVISVLEPPAITQQPRSLTLPVGATATFSAAADGSAPTSYLWFFYGNALSDGGQFSGTTTSNLTILNAQTTDSGNYEVQASNPVGIAFSTTASLTVLAPPAITRQPSNQSAAWGGAAVFNVIATGDAPLNYQWTFNGAIISDATNATLMLMNAQPSQAGNYAVVITNLVGAATSSVAALTVDLPPQGVPFIMGIAPAIAYPGATVEIYGTNFSSTAGGNIVHFGAVQASVISATANTLTVNVPPGATFAPITVTVNGLTAFSRMPFLPTFPGGAAVNSFTLGAQQNLSMPSGPFSTVIADLDGDGKPDLIIGNVYAHNVSLFRNISTAGSLTAASFAARVDLPGLGGVTHDNPVGLTVADVDGDGKLDIIICDRNVNQILVYRNTSTPGGFAFAPPVSFPAANDPRHVRAADVDGDGLPDLVVANYVDGTISIFRNTSTPGSVAFAPRVNFAAGAGAYDMAIADLDGDGKPDIAAVNHDAGTISIFRNTSVPGTISASSLDAPVTFSTPADSQSVIAADLDGDGKLDLLTGSIQPQLMSTFLNQSTPGTLSFPSRSDYGAPGWVHEVTAGDINGDGKVDAVIDGELSSYMAVFQNNSAPGAISLGGRVDFPTGYNAWGVSVGDLDGDGRPDVALANVYDNTLSLYQNQTPFSNGPPIVTMNPTSQTVAVGNTLTLAGAVIGPGPVGWQWYFAGAPLADGGRVAGSLSNALTISNAQMSDAGNYYFIVTNSYGAATSSVAVVSAVALPPVITQQPQSKTNATGSTAILSATISGSTPMTFQWFNDSGALSDGGRISGSLSNVLTISNLQTNDTANYRLAITNAAGWATSSVVTLTVLTPPSFTLQPVGQAVIAGTNATFTADVAGDLPITYQWRLNGTALSDDGIHIIGSTTTTLAISNAQSADTGSYTLLASNVVGTATSSAANLSLVVAPAIARQPVGFSSPIGISNALTGAASGNPLNYQWQLNGADIPGATNANYIIHAMRTNDAGIYQLIVSNVLGAAASSNAWVTVGPVAAWGFNGYNQCVVPPGLSDVTGIAGGYSFSLASRLDGGITAWGSASLYTNSTFTNLVAVAASSSGAIGLRADGSVAGSSSLTVAQFKFSASNAVAIAAGNAFGLALRAEGVVAGWGYIGSPAGAGRLPSAPPGLNHVTAISAGYIHAMALRNDGTVVAWGSGAATNVPIGLSGVIAIAAGSTHSLALKANGTIVAWGSGPGTNVPAGLSNVAAISALNYYDQNSSASFAVRSNGTVVAWGYAPNSTTNIPAGLSNVVAVSGSSLHQLALVNNDGRPILVSPPVGGTVWSGNDYRLKVTAAGTVPLNYQWLFNDTNIDGATNSILTISAIQAANSGNYQVIVSNSAGAAASLPVPLNVIDGAPFLLTISPTNSIGWLGNKFSLSAAAGGSGPLQYQWRFNGADISGATNDTLAFGRLHLTNGGNYALVATNSFGAITSSVVKLTAQQVLVWGDNIYAETNMPPGLTNAIAISANFFNNIVLRADGTVALWGNGNSVSTNTAGISNVVEVSAGSYRELVLKSNGRPMLWGGVSSSYTNVVAQQSNIVAIAATSGSSCALLRADGVLIQALDGGTVITNNGVTNGIALATCDDGYLVLRADGKIYGYEGGLSGQGTGVSNAVALAAGRYQGLALKRDGTAMGVESYLPVWPGVTNFTGLIGVASAMSGPEFVVRSDGSIAISTNAYSNPATNVPYGLTSVQTLDAGYSHCLALLSDRDFPPVFLHMALNTTNLVVSSQGSAQWFGQTNISHDGFSAAQSAAIGNNTASSMRTWVYGPTSAKFWCKVSSSPGHGVLSVSAGGNVLTNISGDADWRQITVHIPPGGKILQWTYSKDGAPAAGMDAAWVDQLQFTNIPPTIVMQPAPARQIIIGGTNVTAAITLAVAGTPPFNYAWQKDGLPFVMRTNANAEALIFANVTRANSGAYFVIVTNLAGSTTSSNAVLDVHVPQLLSVPTMLPDGSLAFSAMDSDGQLISASVFANLQLQSSSNLMDWTTVPGGLIYSNGVVYIQDINAVGQRQRFYRVIENW
jgi:alpha-tubulin suppressor-like RCC1 family protein